MEGRWKYVLWGAIVAMTMAAAGTLAVLYSGIYPIAANEPHTRAIGWMLTTLQENAVAIRADDLQAPDLADAALLADGLALYHQHCMVCHGAPGVERALMGRGLNPDPPRLATEIRGWTNAELFWIVANGLKMAGMPAFQPGLTDREVWATVAFMRALPQVTPGEYRQAAESAPNVVLALMEERRRRATVQRGAEEGDATVGRRLVEAYGCGSCHVIPGVANSKGHVGPPLTDFGLRHYIAGAVLNTPDNLSRWLVSPETVEPGTAMPDVGVAPEEARHMAAYLLSLGADASLVGPKGVLPAGWLPKH